MAVRDYDPAEAYRLDHPTPRPAPASTRCVAPHEGRGRGVSGHLPAPEAPRPILTRPGGSSADYEALCAACDVYRRAKGRTAQHIAYETVRAWAEVCGCPAGEPPLAWATCWVSTYRDQMAGGFVGRVG